MQRMWKYSALAVLCLSSLLAAQQPVVPGSLLGSLTPITTANGTLNAVFPVVINTGAPSVLVQLDQTTTITAGAIRFQVSYDGTNYVNVSSDAVTDPTSTTNATISMPYTLVASTNKAFLVALKGAQALQILVSTAMTGTGAITPFYSVQPQFNGSVPSRILGSTGTALDSGGALLVGGKVQAPNLANFGASFLTLEETGAVATQDGGSAYQLWNGTTFTGFLNSSVGTIQTGSTLGTLFLSFSSITGSPSGCSVSAVVAPNINVASSATSFWQSASLGTLSTTLWYLPVYNNTGISAAILANSAGMGAVQFSLSCSVYPSAGTVTGTFVPSQPVNIAGANGYAALVSSAGALSAGLYDAAGNGLTSNSTTYTAKFGLDGNLLGTLGTAFSTAGKVDVKAATGDLNANIAQVGGTATDTNSGSKSGGTLRVVLATDQPQLTNKLLVTPDSDIETVPVATATTTNTASRCTLVSAASTNSTNCKNAAGNVYGFRFVNTTATLYYLRMYNSSSAPTCSSATGFVESIPIPASATGAGVAVMEPFGEGYTTGISFCFTGGSSSTDNTNAATGVFGTILYK